jgi:hypothetical protein
MSDAIQTGWKRSGKLKLLNGRNRYSQGKSFTMVLAGWPLDDGS